MGPPMNLNLRVLTYGLAALVVLAVLFQLLGLAMQFTSASMWPNHHVHQRNATTMTKINMLVSER